MFHFSYLAVVSETATDVVTWVSIGCIAALAIALTLLCIFGKKYSTREIAYAGICLALSFALSFIKVSPVQYGGSITLASFVPLLIYAYKFGPVKGTLAGIMLGLFNFISGPYILTPLTFVLDYVLAFASIGLMGFAPKFGKLPLAAKVSIGTVLVYVARFISHLLSGFIYFAENSIWVDLPTPNMFVYSFIYQCVYLPADCVICVIALFTVAKTKALDRLLAMMDIKKTKQTEAVAEGAAVEEVAEAAETAERTAVEEVAEEANTVETGENQVAAETSAASEE